MASNIKAGTIQIGSDGNRYRWLGAQWGLVNPKTDKTWRMASKDMGSQLTSKAKSRSSGSKEQAKNWFRNVLKDDRYKKKAVPKVGRMYAYRYSAKGDGTDALPYWDKFPLIILVGPAPGGFYGINFHYLRPQIRQRLLGKLLKFRKDSGRLSEKTILKLSWDLINSASRFPEVQVSFKHYLDGHVMSRIVEVPPEEWSHTILLPMEAFKGASRKSVWADAKRQMRRI